MTAKVVAQLSHMHTLGCMLLLTHCLCALDTMNMLLSFLVGFQTWK